MLGAACALLIVAAPSALAASPGSVGKSVGRDSELITITRPIRDVAVDPGEHHVEDVVIQNQTARSIIVATRPQDLGTRRSGSRELDFKAAGSQPRGAGTWLSITNHRSIRIEPYTQATVHVAIDVPADAGAGAWGGAERLTISGANQAATVSLKPETSIVFLLTVRGAAQRELLVSATSDRRLLLNGSSSTWHVKITNAGDEFESFGGHLEVDAGIGGSHTYALQSGILFPGETRREQIRTNVRPAPDIIHGRVTVTSRGRSGASGEPTDMKRSASAAAVFVLPWWFPVALILALIAIIARVRLRGRHDYEAIEQYEV